MSQLMIWAVLLTAASHVTWCDELHQVDSTNDGKFATEVSHLQKFEDKHLNHHLFLI